MSDPWPILELNPSTADERDVRVAYARLLKLHPPDKDALGFQRVREAYQAALGEIRGGGLADRRLIEGETTIISSLPPARSLPSELSPPPDWIAAAKALADAVAGKRRQVIREAFGSLAAALGPAEHGSPKWGEMVLAAFGSFCPLLAETIRDEDLMALIASENSSFLEGLLLVFEAGEEIERVRCFCDKLKLSPLLARQPLAAVVLARLACFVGFHQSSIGRRLGELAEKALPAAERIKLMNRVDQAAALGTLFASLPVRDRHFWWRRTLGAEAGNADWRSPASIAYLNQIVSLFRPEWPGYALVHQYVPTEIWQWIRSALLARYGFTFRD